MKPIDKYRELTKSHARIEKIFGDDVMRDSELVDCLLDEMELLWWKLTQEEQDLLDEELKTQRAKEK